MDRLLVKPGIEKRLEASIETATKLANGLVLVAVVNGEERLYSQKLACPDCGTSVPQLEPRSFSFNSPYGACETCAGLGMLPQGSDDRPGLRSTTSPARTATGKRLRPASLAVRVKGLSIGEFTALPVARALPAARAWQFSERERQIAGRIAEEIRNRLEFLSARSAWTT